MITLTRFLYDEQEVKLSFISAMLKQRDICECYYWASELYYSNIDIFQLLLQLYNDYYAMLNPFFEHFIIKKMNQWISSKNINYVFYCIINMYVLKHDYKVFIMRQLYNTDTYPTIIQINKKKQLTFKINKEEWLSLFDVKFHHLLVSIKYIRYNNICYYLKELIKSTSTKDIYIMLIQYYSMVTEKIADDNTINEMLIYFTNRQYNDEIHSLLTIICYLEYNNTNISDNKMKLYIRPNPEHILFIKNIELELIPLNKNGIRDIYKTLEYKRLYSIDCNIGSFNLNRYTFDTFEFYKNEILTHWDYYASGSKLWNDRIIQEYNGSINHNTKLLEFENDDKLEEFYSKYGFDLDEQPKNIQDLSLLYIEKTNYTKWIEYIYNNTDLLKSFILHDNFIFN